MDLLYAGNVEGFVIVSTDSDFTRFATRLRRHIRRAHGSDVSGTTSGAHDVAIGSAWYGDDGTLPRS
jgi:hypothetical protein